jgi:hypothetical protein
MIIQKKQLLSYWRLGWVNELVIDQAGGQYSIKGRSGSNRGGVIKKGAF